MKSVQIHRPDKYLRVQNFITFGGMSDLSGTPSNELWDFAEIALRLENSIMSGFASIKRDMFQLPDLKRSW